MSAERGFTLIEILIVIVLLGVLSVITVFAVRGITDRGEKNSCLTDGQTLERVAEYYIAESGGNAIPATGLGVDRFEQTLVDAKLLNDVSTFHDLAADGTIVSTGTPCP